MSRYNWSETHSRIDWLTKEIEPIRVKVVTHPMYEQLSTITAINVLATALSMRTPGMTLARMPLFVWMFCVVAFQILVALPPLTEIPAALPGPMALLLFTISVPPVMVVEPM